MPFTDFVYDEITSMHRNPQAELCPSPERRQCNKPIITNNILMGQTNQ